MKKRILSILLTLCMTLCLTPISVFAEEVGAGGSAAIQLGADALSVLSKNVNTATAPTVYFGQNHENNPAAWRVIGYDGSGVTSAQGDITLLAAGAMGVIPFVDTILNNEYAPSNLKTAIDALAAKLTTEENAAVKKRALTSGSYDGENTDCVAGGQVDNAVFWPLSTAEAFAVNNDLRALEPAHPNWVTTAWWLRSPGSNKYHLAVVTSDGSVQYSGHTILIFNNHRTVRPAFKLNMNSVLFTSAAVGGKPNGGLTAVPEYSGNEWKLTLLDSRRNFAVTEKTVSAAPDDTVTLNYKGATTGKNEYISVILADNNGAQYYGRVAQPTAESGTVEIKIPSDIAPGDYTMKVFSEQYNGDCKTDLASAFADVTLTVESQPDEQFTLASGGRYYFDLSAMNIPGTVNSNLPDSTLHYVPFTYVGTVNAYRLTSETATTEEYAQKNKYPHSLFVADYAVTHTVSWDNLNTAGLIFGKDYAAGGVDYTLRAPSVGSSYTGSGDSERGTPKSNEWDKILDKDDGYIKNWREMLSCGQDTTIRISASFRAVRGWKRSARFWTSYNTSYSTFGFRPVLEVLNPDTLGSDGLKVVTLDLGGGTLGNSSEDIQIIVKNGESFTAPATEGLSRPNSISEDAQLYWSDENGNCYKPGDTVPADVSRLSITGDYEVIYLPGTYGTGSAVTDMKPHNNILTLRGALFTRAGYTQVGWSTVDGGEKVYGFEDIYTKNEALTLYPVWNTNKYTITFDTNGGSEIAPITQDYGTEITAPDNPTRKGYTFKGWDKEIPKTMPAENITVKAQWKINQYTITFDTNGGSEIAPITQDYGTEITAPDNPTRKGYTFKGWDKEIPETMPAENITVKAQWEINQYTITFDTNGGSEIAPITQDYGTEITAPDNPTREGYTFIGWDKAIPTTMPAENITVTAQWKDSEKPTGEIKINENSWKAFLNNITFGLFFKDTQTVTINAADNSGETVTVEYLLSDKELTKAELDGMTFTVYTAPFGIDPDNEYIIYVRLTDNAGNTDYICSDGIVLDGTSPVITGIKDGKIYCEAQTVTITEKYVDTVTVNGTTVTLDTTGSFTLAPADGEQKIVVTDKAGNTAEMTVTVNDGHTYGEWTSNGDGTHTRQCTADGCTEGIETDNCTDEDKNHICDICGNIISNHEDANQDHVCDLCGKVISNHEDADKDHVCDHCGKVISNHEDADNNHICDYCEKVISNHEDADKDHICDHCGKVISNHEDANKDHVCELCGKTISNHEDANKDHVCELCGKTISNHDDADNNHICDYCGKTISNHEDADKDHVCDHCGKVISNHEDANKDHVCELCGKTISNHEDANKDHVCDYCGKVFSNHEDADKDHVCDYCGKVITNHIGGKETCRDKAVCEVCGKSYGKLDPKNHTDLKHFPAKAATEDADGNIEYWYCSGCNKYYSDKDGTKEIAKADTVTAKLPKSPSTGDTSNLMLWIALLFISGSVLTGVTVFDKRKRHSVK